VKTHNEKLRDSYTSTSIIRIIKSRSIRQDGEGIGMWHAWERTELHIAFWWEKMKGRDHFKKLLRR
jgi:hypothetical protein